MIKIPTEIQEVIAAGGVVYVSHSGGKDSQAMYALLSKSIPADRIVVVHADLGAIEWHGVQAHILATIRHELNVVKSSKTFFEMVERRFAKDPSRPCWPSSSTRQCTSDLKRDPIHTFIRRDMKARGISQAVNATGIRAQESTARAKKSTLSMNARLSTAGRVVFEWLPIFELTKEDVFRAIADAGQVPFWAYRENERLSCVFCIMGCGGDLNHGARQRPELFAQYVELEKRTGWTMFNGASLEEKAGVTVAELTS